jgi:hypothetical protein
MSLANFMQETIESASPVSIGRSNPSYSMHPHTLAPMVLMGLFRGPSCGTMHPEGDYNHIEE